MNHSGHEQVQCTGAEETAETLGFISRYYGLGAIKRYRVTNGILLLLTVDKIMDQIANEFNLSHVSSISVSICSICLYLWDTVLDRAEYLFLIVCTPQFYPGCIITREEGGEGPRDGLKLLSFYKQQV